MPVSDLWKTVVCLTTGKTSVRRKWKYLNMKLLQDSYSSTLKELRNDHKQKKLSTFMSTTIHDYVCRNKTALF